MKVRYICAAALGIVASVSTARAEVGFLVPKPPVTDNAFVWRDVQAKHEGLELIRAKVKPPEYGLVNDLLACLPVAGTKVITTAPASDGLSVLVMVGDYVGCRGNIDAAEFFHATPSEGGRPKGEPNE